MTRRKGAGEQHIMETIRITVDVETNDSLGADTTYGIAKALLETTTLFRVHRGFAYQVAASDDASGIMRPTVGGKV